MRSGPSLALVLALALGGCDPAVYYVNNVAGSDANPGTSEAAPFKTIAKGVAATQPGQILRIVGTGTPYAEQLRTVRSGTTTARIRIEGWGAAKPVLTRGYLPSPLQCVLLNGHDYVDVLNLVCDGRGSGPGESWVDTGFSTHVQIVAGSFNRVEGMVLRGASVGYPSVYRGNGFEIVGDYASGRMARYNRIAGNTLETAGSARVPWHGLVIHRGCTNNLVENNDLVLSASSPNATHQALQVQGSWNVIRGNRLSNGVHTSVSFERAPDGSYPGERNVFEGNRVYGAGPSNAMQLQMQRTIVRRNLFHANPKAALAIGRGNGAESARYLRDNRVYHNVFYKNATAGDDAVFRLQINCDATVFGNTENNAFVNNAFFRNNLASPPGYRQVRLDFGFSSPPASCAETASPPRVYGPNGTRFVANSFLPDAGLAGGAIFDVKEPADSLKTLAEAEAAYGPLFAGNREADPMFAAPDAAAPDFSLQAGSPLVDAGAFLTTGSTPGGAPYGTLVVADAGFFSDGRGIAEGDLLGVQGVPGTYRVASVDYDANALYLAAPLPGPVANAGVSLAWNGAAPDIGAVER